MYRSGKQQRILVVEDDVDIRQILCVFLVLTAFTQIAQQIDGFEAGAVEYMTKPTQPSRIVERIRTLLSLSVEQQAMLRRKRIDERRVVLERIRAPQPDEFF